MSKKCSLSGWQQNAAPQRHGWLCYEDQPGKPGLVATTTGASVGFRARVTRPGSVIVHYLRSYEGFGRVSVSVQGHRATVNGTRNATVLDGMWDSPTSQADSAILAIQKLEARVDGSPTCKHPSAVTVWFQLLPPNCIITLRPINNARVATSSSCCQWKLVESVSEGEGSFR